MAAAPVLVAAVDAAVSVIWELVADADGEKLAVTPAGSPETLKLTEPENPP